MLGLTRLARVRDSQSSEAKLRIWFDIRVVDVEHVRKLRQKLSSIASNAEPAQMARFEPLRYMLFSLV